MPVTPTSSLALAIDGLRQLVAESATFRTRVGAANQAEALEKVFVSDVEVSEEEGLIVGLRPFAIVFVIDSRYRHLGAGPQHQAGGAIGLLLTDNAQFTGPDDAPEDSEIDFWNFAGGAVDDIAFLLAGGGDRWPFIEPQLVDFGRNSWVEGENEDFWSANYQFPYGLGRG